MSGIKGRDEIKLGKYESLIVRPYGLVINKYITDRRVRSSIGGSTVSKNVKTSYYIEKSRVFVRPCVIPELCINYLLTFADLTPLGFVGVWKLVY